LARDFKDAFGCPESGLQAFLKISRTFLPSRGVSQGFTKTLN
jgi:hypothetical protein